MKKEIIKNRILEFARVEFAKYGYTKVKTETLVEKLGISKRTLYEYFSSKEQMLSEVIDIELDSIKKRMESIVMRANNPNKDFTKVLKDLGKAMTDLSCTFTREFFEDLKRYSPEHWEKIEKFRVRQIKSNFTKLHSAGIKKGFVKTNINKDIFYLIFHFSLNNILVPEIVSELSVSTKEAAENIIDVLLTGSLTEKGRKDFINECCK